MYSKKKPAIQKIQPPEKVVYTSARHGRDGKSLSNTPTACLQTQCCHDTRIHPTIVSTYQGDRMTKALNAGGYKAE